MQPRLSRPALALVAALLAAAPAHAERTVRIDWSDLIPQEAAAVDPIDEMQQRLGLAEEAPRQSTPRGVVQHGEIGPVAGGAEVVDTYDGKTVELSGFVIPLDYTAEGVTSFMLVPFVGACIHVPPPPPNQLVFVTTTRPFEVAGLFEPYTVTGAFGTATTQTELAEVGYFMKADTVRPYE
ncbi:MAG: DUF3299 domain-containing protein [Acuticoccus sp.]